MEHWEIEKQKAEAKRMIADKYPLLGKKVKRYNEEGIIVLEDDGDGLEYFIKFSDNDLEGLYGLPFQVWDDEKNKWK